MVYAYAVTEIEAPVPALLGLADGALRAIADGSLAVVASDLDPPVKATEEALWRHEGVVEELMRRGPVMPMRFGSLLPDDDAARATLRERGQELSACLTRVRGAVELGVRALWEPAETGASSTSEASPLPQTRDGAGTTYLMQRLGESRRSQTLADDIHTPLAAVARLSTRRLLATPRLLLSGAYLVEETAVDDFRARVDELDERLDGVALICTGPWPPYSFAPPEAG